MKLPAAWVLLWISITVIVLTLISPMWSAHLYCLITESQRCY